MTTRGARRPDARGLRRASAQPPWRARVVGPRTIGDRTDSIQVSVQERAVGARRRRRGLVGAGATSSNLAWTAVPQEDCPDV